MVMEVTVEITNSCICLECCECGILCDGVEVGDECEYCEDGKYEYSPGGCDGDVCWEYMTDDLANQWDEFQKKNPTDTGYYIVYGSGMGWRHRSGHKVFDPTREHELWDIIAVDSMWNQTWTFTDTTCTAVQSHHDAMGESYTVEPLGAEHVKELSTEGILWELKKYYGLEDDYDKETAEKIIHQYIEDNLNELVDSTYEFDGQVNLPTDEDGFSLVHDIAPDLTPTQ